MLSLLTSRKRCSSGGEGVSQLCCCTEATVPCTSKVWSNASPTVCRLMSAGAQQLTSIAPPRWPDSESGSVSSTVTHELDVLHSCFVINPSADRLALGPSVPMQ